MILAITGACYCSGSGPKSGGAGNQYEFTVNGDTLVLTQPGPSSSW